MGPHEYIVFLVDDDSRVREALTALLSSIGIACVAFESGSAYQAFSRPDLPACLVLDLQLPDINGLELQTEMARGTHPPIVFVSGFGDIPSSVRAMKAGAVDFLTKPIVERELLAAVHTAIQQDMKARESRAELAELQQRLSRLTPREREVLPLVASGLPNKQSALELGISEVTLQIHRGKVMRKMGAESLVDLARMAALLDVPSTLRRPD